MTSPCYLDQHRWLGSVLGVRSAQRTPKTTKMLSYRQGIAKMKEQERWHILTSHSLSHSYLRALAGQQMDVVVGMADAADTEVEAICPGWVTAGSSRPPSAESRWREGRVGERHRTLPHLAQRQRGREGHSDGRGGSDGYAGTCAGTDGPSCYHQRPFSPGPDSAAMDRRCI